MLITFEGLDCSGKSTQARILVDRLRAGDSTEGREIPPVHLIRDPGGTPISEKIRAILLDRDYAKFSEVTELLLFSASRSQLVTEVIAPILLRGEIAVCDRFYDSTTAYQGYGRGIDLSAIANINRLASSGIVPDLTVFLDIPLEEIDRRKHLQGEPHDRMEISGGAFYERVRKGYLEIAGNEQRRFMVMNGLASVEETAETIWKAVNHRLHTRTHT